MLNWSPFRRRMIGTLEALLRAGDTWTVPEHGAAS
jgi:hypothetical protein